MPPFSLQTPEVKPFPQDYPIIPDAVELFVGSVLVEAAQSLTLDLSLPCWVIGSGIVVDAARRIFKTFAS